MCKAKPSQTLTEVKLIAYQVRTLEVQHASDSLCHNFRSEHRQIWKMKSIQDLRIRSLKKTKRNIACKSFTVSELSCMNGKTNAENTKIGTETDENISIDAQIFPVQEIAFHC